MTEQKVATTVWLSPETVRELQIYQILTDERISTLASRLLEDYLRTTGADLMTKAGFVRVAEDYGSVLEKLKSHDSDDSLD